MMAMSSRYDLPARDRSRYVSPALTSLAMLIPLTVAAASGPAKEPTLVSPPERRFSVVSRVVAQEQGDWRVDYRLRLDSAAAVVLTPAELGATVDGWVSNSRVPSHAVPRRSSPKVDGSSGSATAVFETIPDADDARVCRERLVFRAWPAGTPEPAARVKNAAADPMVAVRVEPGGVLCVRLRLEHEHFLYGPYDPMLGLRDVELRLGPTTLRDVLPLDREHYVAQAKTCWPDPPEDRRDTRHFVSGPDSLHLEAHIPGNQYYRFDEKPVRHGTRVKLSFWYLTAPGGDGDFKVRVAQYADSPTGWRPLTQGAIEQSYCLVGRWTRAERIFRTEAEATSMALDFRVCGEVGEVWIDDVKLQPIAPPPGGP
jgi:hypothetical protein